MWSDAVAVASFRMPQRRSSASAVRGALSLPDDVTLVSTGGVGSSSGGYAGVLLGGIEEAFGHHEEELEVFVHCHALDEADVGEDFWTGKQETW